MLLMPLRWMGLLSFLFHFNAFPLILLKYGFVIKGDTGYPYMSVAYLLGSDNFLFFSG